MSYSSAREREIAVAFDPGEIERKSRRESARNARRNLREEEEEEGEGDAALFMGGERERRVIYSPRVRDVATMPLTPDVFF